MQLDPDTSRTQLQAAVRLAEQSEFHATLVGKALLNLQRNMKPRAWADWVTKARIPGMAIAKYIRVAEAFIARKGVAPRAPAGDIAAFGGS